MQTPLPVSLKQFNHCFKHYISYLSIPADRWQDKEQLGRLIALASLHGGATDGNESVAPSLLFSTTYLVLNQVCFANKPKWKRSTWKSLMSSGISHKQRASGSLSSAKGFFSKRCMKCSTKPWSEMQLTVHLLSIIRARRMLQLNHTTANWLRACNAVREVNWCQSQRKKKQEREKETGGHGDSRMCPSGLGCFS